GPRAPDSAGDHLDEPDDAPPGATLADAPQARLRHRDSRRVALLLAGESRRAGTAYICGHAHTASRLSRRAAPALEAQSRIGIPTGHGSRQNLKALELHGCPDLPQLREELELQRLRQIRHPPAAARARLVADDALHRLQMVAAPE